MKKNKEITFKNILYKYVLPYKKNIFLLLLISVFVNILIVFQTTIFTLLFAIFNQHFALISNNSRDQFINSSFFDLNFLGDKFLNLLNLLNTSFFYQIFFTGIFFITLSFFTYLSKFLLNILQSKIEVKTRENIRREILENIIKLNFNTYIFQRSASIVSMLVKDTEGLAIVSGKFIKTFFLNLSLTIIYFLFLVKTSQFLTFWSIAIFFVHIFITKLLLHPIKKAQENMYKNIGDLSNIFNNFLINFKLYKFIKSEVEQKKIFNKNLELTRKSEFKSLIYSYIQEPLRSFYDSLIIVLLLILITYQLINNEINFQGALFFLFFVKLISKPISDFATNLTWISEIKASYLRIATFLNSEKQFNYGSKSINKFNNKIQFQNVSFFYDKKNTILKNINFSIKKNKKIFIFGKTGSGKSSIIDLLLCFNRPTNGKILIDGENIEKFKRFDYLSLFSLVNQESFLVDGTIRDNLIFGRNNISDKELKDIISLCKSDFIYKLKKGLDTIVAERGGNLSGGQKQKICIMRALLSNPKILILDEPTSSLDFNTKKEIMELIDQISKNRTVVIISHDILKINPNDYVVIIKNNQIYRKNYHKNLLITSSNYNKFI
jgi:ABC-type multidrug transport system fused ATPase/permease subunit